MTPFLFYIALMTPFPCHRRHRQPFLCEFDPMPNVQSYFQYPKSHKSPTLKKMSCIHYIKSGSFALNCIFCKTVPIQQTHIENIKFTIRAILLYSIRSQTVPSAFNVGLNQPHKSLFERVITNQ